MYSFQQYKRKEKKKNAATVFLKIDTTENNRSSRELHCLIRLGPKGLVTIDVMVKLMRVFTKVMCLCFLFLSACCEKYI